MSDDLNGNGRVHMRQGRLILLLAGCLFSSSCGLPDDGDAHWVLAEGDWGWNSGKGCIDQSDMIRIEEDDVIVFFEGGMEVRRGLVAERKKTGIPGSTGTGWKINGAQWQIVLNSSDAGKEVVLHRYNFSISGRAGRRALLLNTIDEKNYIDGKWEEKWQRIRNKDNPRRGDRLRHCDRVTPKKS